MGASLNGREFSASEISAAAAYVRSLPSDAKVYIEEWTGLEWGLVYGDDREHAVRCLLGLRGRRRLRVRLRDF
jgi:hypothetical protein